MATATHDSEAPTPTRFPRLRSAAEVERLTGGALSAREARRQVRLGNIRPPVAVRLGRRVLFNEDLLAAWLRNGGTAAHEGGADAP